MARVLLVDDEEGIRKTIGFFLKNAGHDVSTAGNVGDALAMLEECEFDVVLSDIIMPGGDGVQLLERVKEKAPETQFVLFTGEPTLNTATDALRLGAFDYLAKPVHKETVCRVVERACAARQLQVQNRKLQVENERHRLELERLVEERTSALRATANDLRATMKRLSVVLESTTLALSTAMEMRDPYTAGHQRRVTSLACKIWDQLGLPSEARDGLRMAGLLHDIGKIRVPSDILSKPVRLSRVEFALIQEHPVTAWEILRLVEFPWPVAQIVRQHHERLDGRGYPDGLTTSKILMEARVLGVADVVEAMASHRPYRPALGIEAALEEIEGGKGTVYWDDAVDACLYAFRKGGYQFPA